YAFIPVVYDEKKQREKVSAKLVLTRNHLQKFHEQLDQYLQAEIPQIYERGVVNGQTVGVETVQELKQLKLQEKALSEEINKLTSKHDDIQSEIQAKNEELEAINFNTFDIETKPVAFQKKYIKVDKDEFKDIEQQASSATIYKNKYSSERSDRERIQRENWRLSSRVKELEKELKTAVEPLKEKLSFANKIIRKLTAKFTSKTRDFDDFWQDFQNSLEKENVKSVDKERKDRKDGKVNLISDMLNKHSGSGNTQRDKPKREREDRGPSL